VVSENEPGNASAALAYVVDRGHVPDAGRLSLAEQLRGHVIRATASPASTGDYVAGDRGTI